MNPILTRHTDDHNDTPRYHWWCPGCDSLHVFDERWVMTGSLESPTFDGSYLSRSNRKRTAADGPGPNGEPVGEYDIPFGTICHSYVRAGRIEYLSDCTHSLAGQTINMVPLPDAWVS